MLWLMRCSCYSVVRYIYLRYKSKPASRLAASGMKDCISAVEPLVSTGELVVHGVPALLVVLAASAAHISRVKRQDRCHGVASCESGGNYGYDTSLRGIAIE